MEAIPYISEKRVKELLNWEKVYSAIEAAMRGAHESRANQPPRTFTPVGKTRNVLLSMPGYLQDDTHGALGCKLVTAFPSNSTKDLPTILAHISLFDEDTGVLKAVISATEITKWRTAAASVVATKNLFTRASNQPLILAIMGAGTQGEIHAQAFHHFYDFQEIRIWNRSSKRATDLAGKFNKTYKTTKFIATENGADAVKNADIIVTATFSSSAIVQKGWLKSRVHINAVGAGIEHFRELSEDIYRNCDLYTDHLEGAQVELKGLLDKGIPLKGDVGGIITQKLPLPTKNITVFQSLGMAVEDCAAARLIYDLHMK